MGTTSRYVNTPLEDIQNSKHLYHIYISAAAMKNVVDVLQKEKRTVKGSIEYLIRRGYELFLKEKEYIKQLEEKNAYRRAQRIVEQNEENNKNKIQ